jgi:DnaJ-domain-containing protein 1
MLSAVLQHILSRLDPAQAKQGFLIVQIAFVVIILLAVRLMLSKNHESSFRVREADRKKPSKPAQGPGALAQARIQRKEPLMLAGIRIDGEPHEILGIPKNSEESVIQRAYRDLMKRYHPDVIGRPGTREWADAQKIAEAINQARKQMIAAQPQSPKRSGR